jgi:hypothetical protein
VLTILVAYQPLIMEYDQYGKASKNRCTNAVAVLCRHNPNICSVGTSFFLFICGIDVVFFAITALRADGALTVRMVSVLFDSIITNVSAISCHLDTCPNFHGMANHDSH